MVLCLGFFNTTQYRFCILKRSGTHTAPKWLLSLCQATCAAFNCHTRKLETLPSAGFASDRRTGVMCVGETQKQSMSSVDLGPSNFLPPGHSNELSAECHIWPVMHRHQNTEQNIAKEPQFCIFPIKIGLEEAVQLEFKGRSYCPKFCIMHHNCLSTLCFKWESHVTRKRHWCLSSKKAIRYQRD